MRLSNPDSARRNHFSICRTPRRVLYRTTIPYPYLAAVIILAVAVVLLSSSGAWAIGAEVPSSHWSYDAFDRLEDAGLLEIDARSDLLQRARSDTRYGMAQRLIPTLEIVAGLVQGNQPDLTHTSPNFLTESAFEAASARLELLKARRMADALLSRAKSPNDSYSQLVLEAAGNRLNQRIATHIEQIKAEPQDESANLFQAVRNDIRSAMRDALSQLTAEDAMVLAHEVELDLADVISAWLGVVDSHLFQAKIDEEQWTGDETFAAIQVAELLAADIGALTVEFQEELRVLGVDEAQTVLAMFGVGNDGPGRSMSLGNADLADSASSLTRGPGASIEALRSAERLNISEGSWQLNTDSALDLSPDQQVSAEYGFRILGAQLVTNLTLEPPRQSDSDHTNARIGASIPLLNDRGAIQAEYSVVDVDHLRDLVRSGSWARRSGGGQQQRRLGLESRLALSESASVKIGYEVRSEIGDSLMASLSDGQLGAELEYRLGEGVSLSAGYSWGVGEGSTSSAGLDLGLGYSLGDNTSILATFGLIRFDDGSGQDLTNIGEAEIVVRF